MKVKALITLVVGKGVEIAPNKIADIAESEARHLIKNGFAEALPKGAAPNPRQKQQESDITPIQPPSSDKDDGEETGDNEGDGDDPDGKDGGDVV